jgi:hypothetical protein
MSYDSIENDLKDDLKKINDNHFYKSRAIGTIDLEHGPASVKWVDLTCSEREARTASAKQQLVRSAYSSWLRCRG